MAAVRLILRIAVIQPAGAQPFAHFLETKVDDGVLPSLPSRIVGIGEGFPLETVDKRECRCARYLAVERQSRHRQHQVAAQVTGEILVGADGEQRLRVAVECRNDDSFQRSFDGVAEQMVDVFRPRSAHQVEERAIELRPLCRGHGVDAPEQQIVLLGHEEDAARRLLDHGDDGRSDLVRPIESAAQARVGQRSRSRQCRYDFSRGLARLLL